MAGENAFGRLVAANRRPALCVAIPPGRVDLSFLPLPSSRAAVRRCRWLQKGYMRGPLSDDEAKTTANGMGVWDSRGIRKASRASAFLIGKPQNGSQGVDRCQL